MTARPAETETVDYDSFMSRDNRGRFELFQRMTPESRADAVKTHIRRFLGANRHRLDSEQIHMLEEYIEFLKPELYRAPHTEENDKRRDELIERTYALFSREDVYRAFYMRNGERIPETMS